MVRIETFKAVVRNNVPLICAHLLEDSNNLRYITRRGRYRMVNGRMEPRGIDSEERRTNAMIFSARLQSMISHLAGSDGMANVMRDYFMVRRALEDPGRFAELESMCRNPLWHFMHPQRVRYVPYKDQLQEGRLAIWKAAHNYQALNFSRFSTFARGALTFKFKNMLRAFTADKRTIQKFTSPAGSAMDSRESLLARQIDERSFEQWQNSMRPDSLNGVGPFTEMAVEMPRPMALDEARLVVISDGRVDGDVKELGVDNFPHMNESELVFVTGRQMEFTRVSRAQNEFFMKMAKGEVWKDENGTLRPLNPSPLLAEFEEGMARREAKRKKDGLPF